MSYYLSTLSACIPSVRSFITLPPAIRLFPMAAFVPLSPGAFCARRAAGGERAATSSPPPHRFRREAAWGPAVATSTTTAMATPPPPPPPDTPPPVAPDPPPSPVGAGWVRREPLLSGRAVVSDAVAWSVPEMAAVPANAYEAAVWAAGQSMAYAKEKTPFLALRSKVLASPRRPNPFVDRLTASADVAVLTRLTAGVAGAATPAAGAVGVAVSAAADITRARVAADAGLLASGDGSGGGGVVLAADLVAGGYAVWAARLAGADAVVVPAAVFGGDDLRYLIKAVAVGGAVAVVEVHDAPQAAVVRALAEAGVPVGGVLLCARNLDTLEGGTGGMADLYDALGGDAYRAAGGVVLADPAGEDWAVVAPLLDAVIL